MPTGRVRGLRESPALVSAGPPTALTTTRGKDIDDGRTAAPGVHHRCDFTISLRGPVSLQPASSASQHSRPSASGGSVGSRMGGGVPRHRIASVTLQSRRVSLRSVGVTVRRSDGARSWSRVLTELAQVRVSVEWERPTWRVSWQDGPTREALMRRAAALGGYRVGRPLPFEELRFARSNSAVAIALAWLARGSAQSPAAARAAVAEVAEMGLLLAQAVPPVAPADPLGQGPELIGRVVSSRWPAGGPPEELLGPSGQSPEVGSGTAQPRPCQRCGKPLTVDRPRGGRPAKYCSGACRTAAHRALHRTPPEAPRR